VTSRLPNKRALCNVLLTAEGRKRHPNSAGSRGEAEPAGCTCPTRPFGAAAFAQVLQGLVGQSVETAGDNICPAPGCAALFCIGAPEGRRRVAGGQRSAAPGTWPRVPAPPRGAGSSAAPSGRGRGGSRYRGWAPPATLRCPFGAPTAGRKTMPRTPCSSAWDAGRGRSWQRTSAVPLPGARHNPEGDPSIAPAHGVRVSESASQLLPRGWDASLIDWRKRDEDHPTPH
jgi:hypothetical protein